MFRHLLVPLDGSRLAEAVLPAAAYLAENCQATLTLFHVIERSARATIHGERHLTDSTEAQTYLDEIAARLRVPGVPINRHVHTAAEGDVARSIAAHAEELGADLIVLCSHGRGGLRDMLFGSIAQQVLQHGTTPIFLVRPMETGAAAPFTLRKILVPLDAAHTPDLALTLATEMARACGTLLHLLVVVPTLTTLAADRAATGLLLPTATMAVLDLAQRGAVDYVQGLAEQLKSAGLAATGEVCRGDPAPTVVEVAERVGADLIVMGTHGRAGLDAFWSGSVGPKVLRRFYRPFLLVRV